jgi:hypothetical protein
MATSPNQYFKWADGPFSNREPLKPGATVYPMFASTHLEGSETFRGRYTAQFPVGQDRDKRLHLLQERRMLVGIFEGAGVTPDGKQRVAYCKWLFNIASNSCH